ncbi:hypothetical protein QBC41DRAFT_214185 [Cercophora samala]|uniref:Uncharacterized protein n=1 Tax=Cercophora samala TaxID=330535 RepID=A0AA39ZMA9_9PEZI|nr:hypothetical protein QBC41DRAFT_214185 [Cercophora samala]
MAAPFSRVAAAGLRSPVRTGPLPSKGLQTRAFGSSGPGFNREPVTAKLIRVTKLAIGITGLGLIGAITYDVTDELLHRQRQRQVDYQTLEILRELEGKLLDKTVEDDSANHVGETLDYTETEINNAGGVLSDAQEEVVFVQTQLDDQKAALLENQETQPEVQETQPEVQETQLESQKYQWEKAVEQTQARLVDWVEWLRQREEGNHKAKVAMESRLDGLASKIEELSAHNVSEKVSAEKVTQLEASVMKLRAELKKEMAAVAKDIKTQPKKETQQWVNWYTVAACAVVYGVGKCL